MEVTEDYMTGSVFRETITVLGWTRMKGPKRFYAIKCSECAKDPELFGEGIFETTKDALVTQGYQPCGCGWAYRFTKEQYETKIQRKADELNVEFIDWVDGFKTGGSKILMSCEEGIWTPRASFFIQKGHIAFNRGKARKDDSLIIEKFFSTGVFHEDTKFSRHRMNGKWYWKVECPVCNEIGYSQSQHLQRGNRACECGNYKQKFSYITLISDNDIPIAVKFGITRSKDLRIKYQARETSYDLQQIGIWEYSDKQQCVTAEKVCKKDLTCGILNKEEFGDGYTETTYVYNIDKIIQIYEANGGLRAD